MTITSLHPLLPHPVRVFGQPVSVDVDATGLRLAADRQTDWFVNPATGEATLTAPAVLMRVGGDFLFQARVEVEFDDSFDAGVLVVWHDEATWAKLSFEYSPQREPMVVSVVTRGTSDDCNSVVVKNAFVWLRIARMGDAIAFHHSLDGERWAFVRHFRLPVEEELDVGFEAQSPLGSGCAATFTRVQLERATLTALRDGT